jgi:2-desacetyl-2-hydroxyethyl bacteriochlorophyllide A dehydrogenase
VRGVRNTGEGIRVVDQDVDPGHGVRVSVASSGICGSDLHLISFGPSDVTLGHEFGGRLDDGSAVAVVPVLTCGRCPHCRSGHGQQCPEAFGGMYGISRHGGMADEVWVDPRCIKAIPDALPLADACLVEPIAVALHGINRAGVQAGMRVLVIGAGPIGLCAIAVARHLGAVVDVSAHRINRMAAGERLGAGTVAGTDYDVVLDAAGTQGSMDNAVARVRPGGTVGILANFWDPVTMSLAFLIKEVTLVPAFTYGHHHGVSEFEEAVRILGALPELAGTVITHRFPLDEAAEAFRVAADRSTDSIKVVVEP